MLKIYLTCKSFIIWRDSNWTNCVSSSFSFWASNFLFRSFSFLFWASNFSFTTWNFSFWASQHWFVVWSWQYGLCCFNRTGVCDKNNKTRDAANIVTFQLLLKSLPELKFLLISIDYKIINIFNDVLFIRKVQSEKR